MTFCVFCLFSPMLCCGLAKSYIGLIQLLAKKPLFVHMYLPCFKTNKLYLLRNFPLYFPFIEAKTLFFQLFKKMIPKENIFWNKIGFLIYKYWLEFSRLKPYGTFALKMKIVEIHLLIKIQLMDKKLSLAPVCIMYSYVANIYNNFVKRQ